MKISTISGFDKIALQRKAGRRIYRSASTASIRSILKKTSNTSSFFARRPSTHTRVKFSEATQNKTETNACEVNRTQNENGNGSNSTDLIDFSGMDNVVPPTNAEPAQTASLNQNETMENFDPLKSFNELLQTNPVNPSASNAALLNEIDWSGFSTPATNIANKANHRPVPNLVALRPATANNEIELSVSHSTPPLHRYDHVAQNKSRNDFGLISYELFQRAMKTLVSSTSTSASANLLNANAGVARDGHSIDLDMSDQHFGSFHFDSVLDDRGGDASGGPSMENDSIDQHFGPLLYESDSE